jgi:charged multivesicular body protein 5
MRRLFGGSKPAAPPPSLEDATKRLDTRVTTLDEKIKKLDVELSGYKAQLAKTRPGTPANNALKQKALRVLKQKKMYEAQRDQMMGQSFNMEQAYFATQTIQDTIQTVQAMKVGAQAMKQQFKQIKINEIENLQDDMQDLLDTNNEIQDILGRSYSLPTDVDEDDLDAELAMLQDELIAEDSMPSYLKAPSAPTENPSAMEDELQFPAVPQSQTTA